MNKKFHISDVLSVTTGRLVSDRHIEGVCDILEWMSGESLMTHQLPRVGKEAKPVLSAKFPHLSKESLSADLDELDQLLQSANRDQKKSAAIVRSWVSALASRFGSEFAVPKLNENQHEYIDPTSELAEKVHPDRIIVARPRGIDLS